MLWQGSGELDALPYPAQHGPEAEQRGAPHQQRGYHGGGGCREALHECDHAEACIARVAHGDAIEPPLESCRADEAAIDGPQVGYSTTSLFARFLCARIALNGLSANATAARGPRLT